MDRISMGRMVGNMNKWKDEPYPWHNEPVNTHPEEFKDSVWASGDRKPVHEEPCYAIYEDKYPVKQGHLLFIPKTKDAPGMIGLCFQEAYRKGTEMVNEGKITGFNLGMNFGESAGQSIFWPHVHFIPRTDGDQTGRPKGVRRAYPDDPYQPENMKKEKE